MDEGLLSAVILDGRGGARQIDWAAVKSWDPSQGTLWVHLDRREQDVATWLGSDAGLPTVVCEALLADETRPRTAVLDEFVVVILRGVNFEPGAEPEDMTSLRCAIEPHRLITTRSTPMRSAQDLLASLERGRGPKTVGELTARIADRLVERTEQIVNDVDDQVAAFEEELLGKVEPNLRERIGGLRRRIIGLRRYLIPQRDALAQLRTLELEWLSDSDRMYLRESQDTLMRHVETLEAVRERAVIAQDQLASLLADQLNERMYVLSLVAAVFLPLGFLTGLLGINVGGIPGAEDSSSFPIFVAGLVVLVALELWYFRRRGWL